MWILSLSEKQQWEEKTHSLSQCCRHHPSICERESEAAGCAPLSGTLHNDSCWEIITAELLCDGLELEIPAESWRSLPQTPDRLRQEGGGGAGLVGVRGASSLVPDLACRKWWGFPQNTHFGMWKIPYTPRVTVVICGNSQPWELLPPVIGASLCYRPLADESWIIWYTQKVPSSSSSLESWGEAWACAADWLVKVVSEGGGGLGGWGETEKISNCISGVWDGSVCNQTDQKGGEKGEGKLPSSLHCAGGEVLTPGGLIPQSALAGSFFSDSLPCW